MSRRIREICFAWAARLSAFAIVLILCAILYTVTAKGIRTLNWQMITKTPTGDYYTGGGGGIANAIVGSIYIGLGATLLAMVISLPATLFLRVYGDGSRFAGMVRGLLDVLWGVPSIVFGAFGFVLMMMVGLRASLLAGIITVALLELPIMIRAIDEVLRAIPRDLDESAYALGSNKFEVAVRVIGRQGLQGMVSGILLAFGRGVGDAASVLFTAGFTDRIPHSLFEPAATLPLAVFFQLGTPYESVRNRAYGAALVLVILVLGVSIVSRLLGRRLGRYVIR
jgi:phosphate transport system permease protein